MFKVPEEYRVTQGAMSSSFLDNGYNGAFIIPHKHPYSILHFRVIASDGVGWEHVSVSLNTKRCPTWEEMCYIKSLFWDDCDCVVQFHPPSSQYVNNHPFTLHLWREVGVTYKTPPMALV